MASMHKSWLEYEDSALVDASVMDRSPEPTLFPLSFNQRDMWLQRKIHTQPALNNVCVEVALNGPLLPDLLRRALQEVVNRHHTLRTVFLELEGIPYQRVLPFVRVLL